MSATPAYRSLIHLYPRAFRDEYGEDLVQSFGDLVADRGSRAAWKRTVVDLAVTVPHYRLESFMSEPRTTTTIVVAALICTSAGVLSLLTGLYPGVLLLVVAAVLLVVERSRLAQAIRAPGVGLRRRRLLWGGAFFLVFATSLVSYMNAVGQDHVSGTSLVLHNAIGVPSMLATVIFLVVGLLTPRPAT